VTAGTDALQLAAKPGQEAETGKTSGSKEEEGNATDNVLTDSVISATTGNAVADNTAGGSAANDAANNTAANGSAGKEDLATGGNSSYASQGNAPQKPSAPVEKNPGSAKDEKIVVLDAGHGGNDGGTFSGDVIEKNINLAVTKKMQKLLEDKGITVIMTRQKDEYLALEERTAIANAQETDLFVSIHCNSYDADSSVYGMECYHGKGRKESLKCAEMIMDVIDECDEIRSRGPKEANYFVIQYSKCPAVLVEMGFLTNPKECEKLNSDDVF